MKQASRQWYAKLSQALCSRGYTHSINDYSLFVKGAPGHLVVLVVYVDDILLIGDDAFEISELKHFLDGEFKIKDLYSLNYFLGIEITYFDDGILLNQRKFILNLLKEHDCLVVSLVVCPLDLNIKLSTDSGDLLPNPAAYRSLIGKLLFLTHTRPDLCFFVQHLGQFNQVPRVPHMSVALHILRYLKGTVDLGLFYSSASDLSLTAYFNSDWAACADTLNYL